MYLMFWNQSLIGGNKNPEMSDSRKMAMPLVIRIFILDSMRRTSISCIRFTKKLLHLKTLIPHLKKNHWFKHIKQILVHSLSHAILGIIRHWFMMFNTMLMNIIFILIWCLFATIITRKNNNIHLGLILYP